MSNEKVILYIKLIGFEVPIIVKLKIFAVFLKSTLL